MTTITEITEQIVKDINKLRKDNKNKWYYYVNIIKHQDKYLDIKVKGFGLWLQILTINDIRHGSGSEASSVAEFNIEIEEAVEYHL